MTDSQVIERGSGVETSIVFVGANIDFSGTRWRVEQVRNDGASRVLGDVIAQMGLCLVDGPDDDKVFVATEGGPRMTDQRPLCTVAFPSVAAAALALADTADVRGCGWVAANMAVGGDV
jgi:hypothetical protein